VSTPSRTPEILDPLFREAVSAIDVGDVNALERLLAAEPPGVVRKGQNGTSRRIAIADPIRRC
jgi:hypothetical protein